MSSVTPTLLERLERAALLCGRDQDDTLAEIEQAIADIKSEAYPRCNPSAPSHYTQSMAARVLKISASAISSRVERGTLPSEFHAGTRLIPAWAVLKAKEKKEKR